MWDFLQGILRFGNKMLIVVFAAHLRRGDLEYKRLSGYVKTEDVVSAYRDVSHNGYPGLIARQKLMEVDVISYSMGYAVSPSIMYAFKPFEIYLLMPLPAIFGIVWITLLIRGRMVKRKEAIS